MAVLPSAEPRPGHPAHEGRAQFSRTSRAATCFTACTWSSTASSSVPGAPAERRNRLVFIGRKLDRHGTRGRASSPASRERRHGLQARAARARRARAIIPVDAAWSADERALVVAGGQGALLWLDVARGRAGAAALGGARRRSAGASPGAAARSNLQAPARTARCGCGMRAAVRVKRDPCRSAVERAAGVLRATGDAGRGHRPRAAGLRGRRQRCGAAAAADRRSSPRWRGGPRATSSRRSATAARACIGSSRELQTRELSLAGRLPDRELEPGRPDPGLRHAGRLGALLEHRRRQPVADARLRRQGGADQLERQRPPAGHRGRPADHRLGFLGSRSGRQRAAAACGAHRAADAAGLPAARLAAGRRRARSPPHAMAARAAAAAASMPTCCPTRWRCCAGRRAASSSRSPTAPGVLSIYALRQS